MKPHGVSRNDEIISVCSDLMFANLYLVLDLFLVAPIISLKCIEMNLLLQ